MKGKASYDCGEMRYECTSQVTTGESLWDKRAVAKYLGVSPKTIDRWLSEGRGPKGLKVGAHVRFRPADVNTFLESCVTLGGGYQPEAR